MNILYVILLAVLAGACYHAGGLSKRGKWYDFALNTKTRDLGVPAIMVATMTILGLNTWHTVELWKIFLGLFLSFVALFGACTTYNKWVGYFFNRPDKHTVYLESWIMTGFLYGLSMLPYVFIVGHNYIGFSVRCVLLAVLTGLFSHVIGKVFLEEFSRGFLIIITLLLFIK